MSEQWVDAGGVDELARSGKTVVEGASGPVVVVCHEGRFHALHDTCVHKQRSLSRGVVLNGRLVCPGHQWQFDLATGYCAARDRYQPTYAVEVRDGRVFVDVSAPRPTDTPVELSTSGPAVSPVDVEG